MSMLKKILAALLMAPLLALASPVRDHGLPFDTDGLPSPTLGMAGDVAIDPSTGVLYTKDAALGWQASYTPSGSSSTPTFTSVTVSGLTANSMMYPGASGLLTSTAAATNGQLLIGSTGAAPALGTLTGTANQISVGNGAGSITLSLPNTLAIPGTISSINGTATVGSGVAIEVATANFLTQGANISTTPIYTVPSGKGGRYRVTMNTVLVTPDGASSTLPNTLVSWTDSDSNGTPSANIGATSTGNNTNSASLGQIVVYAKAGTAINIATNGYTSGTAGAMKYNARYQVDYLGQ
jgi:hypothetical protein